MPQRYAKRRGALKTGPSRRFAYSVLTTLARMPEGPFTRVQGPSGILARVGLDSTLQTALHSTCGMTRRALPAPGAPAAETPGAISENTGEQAMPFVPANDVVQVSIHFLSATLERATNVIYVYNANGVSSAADVQDVLDSVKTWLTNEWAGVASDRWQTDYLVGRDMNTQEGYIVTDVETINGTVSGGSLPAATTIAMSLRTGLSGRSRRGRIFHVGLPVTFVTDSAVTVGGASSLIDAYNALLPILIGNDQQLVVASFVSGGAPRSTALTTPVLDVILTDRIVDSQDGRKPRAE